ncbi:MAG: hypothetical protein CMJ08_04655 [Pelagibacterales bacterium]|nr:hypothetical protein [Pelagibacterales bacterium]|tara:strand:+ start:4761 stop:5042 length:282 start_codon:yes stop_codon:yes gene_type:complete
MGFENYIKFLTQYFLTGQLYIKFFLLLLFSYCSFIFFYIFFDIVKYLSKKHNVKTKLLTQESNLINLRKKYLDGKINAREYKINTIEILNSKK